jgi:hypothetical protein
LEVREGCGILNTRMNLSRIAVLVIALLGPLATFAQDASEVASRIVEAVRYHPLARQARIQGDVRFRSGPGGITTISGHPLLVQEAVISLIRLGDLVGVKNDATYHFALIGPDIGVTTRVEKKGNRFERLILHAFMMKTERVVEDVECTPTPTSIPKNRVEITEDRIEAWIYGRGVCVQTSTSQIALR